MALRHSSITALLVLAFFSRGSQTDLQAATSEWIGKSSSLWSLRSNWSNNPQNASTILFGDRSVNGNIDLGTSAAAKVLLFQSGSSAFAGGYQFGLSNTPRQKFSLLDSGSISVSAGELVTFNSDLQVGSSTVDSTIQIVSEGGIENPGRLTFKGSLTASKAPPSSQSIIFVGNPTPTPTPQPPVPMKTIKVSGGGEVRFEGALSDGPSAVLAYTQTGGSATFAARTNYRGDTRLSDHAVLTLEVENAISALYANKVTLSDSIIKTSGLDQVFGYLFLGEGAPQSSFLDFGSGDSDVSFYTSSYFAWSGTLTLLNFDIGVDSLHFGPYSGGLTAKQLSSIRMFGSDEIPTMDSNGAVIFKGSLIPEPGPLALIGSALSIFSVLIYRRSRRST